MKTLQDFSKAVDRLNKGLAQLAKHQGVGTSDALSIAASVIQELKAIDLPALGQLVESTRERFARELGESIGNRREDLDRAARDADISFKRYGEFDQFDVFKLIYKGEKVIVFVGSEKLKEMGVSDGAKLCADLKGELTRLKRPEFSRETFLRTTQLAVAMAREAGKAKEGKPKVRDLFPYLVAAFQVTSVDFPKRPSKATFRDYSMAEFAFDLARFGEDGWQCGRHTIRSQAPNMATQKEALALPSKPGTAGASVQILSLWVEG